MLCRFHPVKSHRPTAADPSRAERGCRDSRCKVCRRSLPNRCFTATRSHPRCASRRPNARPSSSPSSPSRVASASASLHSEWPTRGRVHTTHDGDTSRHVAYLSERLHRDFFQVRVNIRFRECDPGSLRVGDGEYMRAGNARRRREITNGTNVPSSRVEMRSTWRGKSASKVKECVRVRVCSRARARARGDV